MFAKNPVAAPDFSLFILLWPKIRKDLSACEWKMSDEFIGCLLRQENRFFNVWCSKSPWKVVAQSSRSISFLDDEFVRFPSWFLSSLSRILAKKWSVCVSEDRRETLRTKHHKRAFLPAFSDSLFPHSGRRDSQSSGRIKQKRNCVENKGVREEGREEKDDDLYLPRL